jgi:formylglycine-generating enzyme
MSCVDWYEAMAFCAWDGAYPPSEAEWNFAASGGNEQRAYPWSNPPGSLTIDCSYANYDPSSPCVGTVADVGATSPKGDGRWGQSDLAGNVYDWMLDWYAPPYPQNPCTDCANLTPTATNLDRMIRGGGPFEPATVLRTGSRIAQSPSVGQGTGIRCARAP